MHHRHGISIWPHGCCSILPIECLQVYLADEGSRRWTRVEYKEGCVLSREGDVLFEDIDYSRKGTRSTPIDLT